MKKNLFIIAAAALALASCSSDETTAVNQGLNESNAIQFRALNDGVTRATAKTAFATDDVIDVFAEYKVGDADAVKYFKDDYKKLADSYFQPSTSGRNYYWPAMTGNKMTFTAIYGATQSSSTAGSLAAAYTPDAASTSQVDLLYARHEVSNAKDDYVPLNFRHMLSQIDVQVKNTNAGLSFAITGVRIGYVANSGTFACTATTDATATYLTQNTWTPATLTGNTYEKANTYKYDVEFSAQDVHGETNATALTGFGTWMLIPQDVTAATAYDRQGSGSTTSAPELNGAYVALKLAIYNYNGTERGASLVTEQWCYWPIPTGSWNPGKKYTYLVDLAGGGYQPADQDNDDTDFDPVLGDPILISASCTIDDWDAVTPATDVAMP